MRRLKTNGVIASVTLALLVSASADARMKSAPDAKRAAVLQALEELNNSSATLEVQLATHEVVKSARELLISNGYTCGSVNVDEYGLSNFEIEDAPKGTQFAKVVAEMRAIGVRVAAGGVDSKGRYIRDRRILLISPLHALLGNDIISTTVLHEKQHATLSYEMGQGKRSLVDAEVKHPTLADGNRGSGAITNVKGYTDFLSFQELYTHADDIERLQQGVPSLDSVMNKSKAETISEKQRDVVAVANEIIDITSRVLSTIQNRAQLKSVAVEDSENNNVLRIDIPFQAGTGSQAVFSVWLPELKGRKLSGISEAELKNVVEVKLHDMQLNAKNFK